MLSCAPTPDGPPIANVNQGSLRDPATGEFAPEGLVGKRLAYSNAGWDFEYRFFQDGKYRLLAVGNMKKSGRQGDNGRVVGESAATQSHTGTFQYTRTGGQSASIRFDKEPMMELAFTGPGVAIAAVKNHKVRCEIDAGSGGQKGVYRTGSLYELSSLCDEATARDCRVKLERSRVPAFRRDKVDIRVIASAVADGITKAGVGVDVWDLAAIRIADEGAEPEQYSVAWAAESGISRIDRYCELTHRYWWLERDGVVIGPDSSHQMHLREREMFR